MWSAAALSTILAVFFGAVPPASAENADKPLLAHWTFDDPAPANLAQNAPTAPTITANSAAPVPSRRGVFGNALDLHGSHALRVDGFEHPVMTEVSLAVWARPTDLGGFRELFRQECGGENRVLFSFQDGGTVLSLGLNIGGYIECDARIKPEQVVDGTWHHCAATFDGQFMRVYLDGKEIGSMDRPGSIAMCPAAPAFIGSGNGTNEHFQGGLDDLRLYAGALTAQDVAGLYRDGMAEIEKTSRALDTAAAGVYAEAPTFAETMVQTRTNLAGRAGGADTDLAEAILGRIKARFPDAYGEFMACTEGASPLDYLSSADDAFILNTTERLMALLTEYKPLTEHQLAAQTEDDKRKWEEADRLQKQFEALRARGAEAAHSPEWINLMLDAGRRVQYRPHVNEPVAPYVKPETPQTRDLSADEARGALKLDWLFQAGNESLRARARKEIGWARSLAERIEKQYPGKVDFTDERAQLGRAEEKLDAADVAEHSLYFQVRTIKRDIMFKNLAVDFAKVLFVDMPYPAGSEWPHETRHRLGYMAVPGARLLVLDGLEPGGKLTQLMPQAPLHGSFWRPDLSFDGSKVLFCFKPHNEKSFHIYEVNTDGTGLVQLTDGPYDDLDPVYTPDGHILFSSTRGHNYVRCMPPTNSFELTRCDADGKNVYIISYSNEPDYLPSVMDDGRVVYTRWEYTDKPLWRAEKLWTTNPDGTQVLTLWGNQSVWPDLMKDAHSIPGTRRVMFTGSAHHNWFSGSVGIIDPDKGFNFPDGLTKVTADVEWPECGNGPVDPVESPNYHVSGKYEAYYSPYPLGERDFLVSAKREGKFQLYLMDLEGNRELVYEGENNIFHAMPLKPRPTPPVIADRVAWPTMAERDNPKPGVLFSNNVYQNAPPELRGKAKYLRVMQIDSKTYTYWYKRPYISTGPVVSAVQSEGVKRIIGTVPIEEDGSFSCVAPPGSSLHFQLLDGNMRALQTMRSFIGVMPGESRGCLGCHESHSRTPKMGDKSIALNKAPQPIAPPPWTDTTVSYARYVRPVLDQYCAKCHEGDGEGRKTFDMTERPAPPVFSEPYLTLIGRPSWGAPYTPPEKPEPGFGLAGVLMVEAYGQVDPQAYRTPKPMTSLSYKSPLIDWVSNGKHHDVKVDPISLQRLIVWVDAMCPYLGDEEVRAIPDPEFQGVDWLSVRPLIKNAPVIPRPGPVE